MHTLSSRLGLPTPRLHLRGACMPSCTGSVPRSCASTHQPLQDIRGHNTSRKHVRIVERVKRERRTLETLLLYAIYELRGYSTSNQRATTPRDNFLSLGECSPPIDQDPKRRAKFTRAHFVHLSLQTPYHLQFLLFLWIRAYMQQKLFGTFVSRHTASTYSGAKELVE